MINVYDRQQLNIVESECGFKSENIICTGSTAKFNATFNFIFHRPDVYSHIYLYTDTNKILVTLLIKKLGSKITILSSIRDMRSFTFKKHSLVIYDYDYAQLNHCENNIKDSFIFTRMKHISCIIQVKNIYNLPSILKHSIQYIIVASKTQSRNVHTICNLLNNIDFKLLNTTIENYADPLNNVCTIKIHSDKHLYKDFDIFNN